MALDTRTLPGRITQGEGGNVVASGWCIIAFEMVGHGKPLEDWRGEMKCASKDERDGAASIDGDLYIHLDPYGGVFEPWHGPVRVEAVDADNDPDGLRLRLRSAGVMKRSWDDGASAEALSKAATG
ncbi:MAG: hypothetical protein DCC58_11220 [Chloroflexi bacterium]|nr:MAG: hypothetical protein DCC58_11220 [Chloroflexota bacterium]